MDWAAEIIRAVSDRVTYPDGKTRNQTDHMMISKDWRRSVEDTRVYRGADVTSEHCVVLKLHRNPDRAKIKARFGTQMLENEICK